MSNTARQRRFRERNPGYYGRLHARRRAEMEINAAERLAAAQALAVKREPLMLPAPVETIEIPGMNMIPAIGAIRATHALSAIPVFRSTTDGREPEPGPEQSSPHHRHLPLDNSDHIERASWNIAEQNPSR